MASNSAAVRGVLPSWVRTVAGANRTRAARAHTKAWRVTSLRIIGSSTLADRSSVFRPYYERNDTNRDHRVDRVADRPASCAVARRRRKESRREAWRDGWSNEQDEGLHEEGRRGPAAGSPDGREQGAEFRGIRDVIGTGVSRRQSRSSQRRSLLEITHGAAPGTTRSQPFHAVYDQVGPPESGSLHGADSMELDGVRARLATPDE